MSTDDFTDQTGYFGGYKIIIKTFKLAHSVKES